MICSDNRWLLRVLARAATVWRVSESVDLLFSVVYCLEDHLVAVKDSLLNSPWRISSQLLARLAMFLSNSIKRKFEMELAVSSRGAHVTRASRAKDK